MRDETRHTPGDFADVLSAEEPPPLVVGGQAVNLWAIWAQNAITEASPDADPAFAAQLEKLAPFTSKDCDVLGDYHLLRRLSEKTGWRMEVFKRAASRSLGLLVSPSEGEDNPRIVEVLHSARGLGPEQLKHEVLVTLGERTYRTLNPSVLLEAKLANAIEIPQENRNDVKHVRILLLVVRASIVIAHQRVVAGAESVQTLKRMLRRTGEVVTSDSARIASKKYGIDVGECFPWDFLAGSTLEPVEKFLKHQRARLTASISAD